MTDASLAAALRNDPYAAIRKLAADSFAYNPGAAATEGSWRTDEVGGWQEGAPTTAASWAANPRLWDDLRPSGFQSKYNNAVDLGDGRMSVTLQRPGGHKYDTMDVVYAPDATTGEWIAQSAAPTQQDASWNPLRAFGSVPSDLLKQLGVSEEWANSADYLGGIENRSVGETGGKLGGSVGRWFNEEADLNADPNGGAARQTAITAAVATPFIAGPLAGAFGGGIGGAAASGAVLGGANASQGGEASGGDVFRGAVRGGVTAAAGAAGAAGAQGASNSSYAGAPTNDFYDIPQSEFTYPSFTGAPANDFFDIPQSEFTYPSFTGAPANDFFDIPQSEFVAPPDVQRIEITGQRPSGTEVAPGTVYFPGDADVPDRFETTGQRLPPDPDPDPDAGNIFTLPSLPRGGEVLPLQELDLTSTGTEPEIELPDAPGTLPTVNGSNRYKDLAKLLRGIGNKFSGAGGADGISGFGSSTNFRRQSKSEEELPTLFDPNYRPPQVRN